MQAEEDKVKAEKERNEAEQHGYDVGVIETEDALRAKVSAVCRAYCTQTWGKALNQARIEASSMLKKAESICYSPTICPVSFSDSKADLASSKAGEAQGSPPKALPIANNSSEGREQAEDTIRTVDVNKDTVQGADAAPTAPGDLLREKETSQSMELALVTLAIPPKVDPKDKAQLPHTAADTSLPRMQKKNL